MDKGAKHSERVAQRQASNGEIKELKSYSQLRDAIAKLGHNRLNEHGVFDEMSGARGKWLENVQTGVIDAGGAAVAYVEDGVVVGFILADTEGVITQFRCLEGKERATLELGLKKLKDKGFDHPKVHMTQKSEDMQKLFEHTGFRKSERTKEGKVVMEKE